MRPITTGTTHLYVIEMPGHSFVKVGIARSVSRRLAQLQVGNPIELAVAATFQVPAERARMIEVLAHSALRPHRRMSEWFAVPVTDATAVLRDIIENYETRVGDHRLSNVGARLVEQLLASLEVSPA